MTVVLPKKSQNLFNCVFFLFFFVFFKEKKLAIYQYLILHLNSFFNILVFTLILYNFWYTYSKTKKNILKKNETIQLGVIIIIIYNLSVTNYKNYFNYLNRYHDLLIKQTNKTVSELSTGPALYHGIIFSLTSSYFFMCMFSKYNLFSTKNTFKTKTILYSLLWSILTGAYWAFNSSIWGFWFNWDEIEIFFLINFFFIVWIIHSKNINIKIIKQVKIIFTINVMYLWLIRAGFITTRHTAVFIFNNDITTIKKKLIYCVFCCIIAVIVNIKTIFNNWKVKKKAKKQTNIVDVLKFFLQINSTYFFTTLLLFFIFYLISLNLHISIFFKKIINNLVYLLVCILFFYFLKYLLTKTKIIHYLNLFYLFIFIVVNKYNIGVELNIYKQIFIKNSHFVYKYNIYEKFSNEIFCHIQSINIAASKAKNITTLNSFYSEQSLFFETNTKKINTIVKKKTYFSVFDIDFVFLFLFKFIVALLLFLCIF